MRKDARNVLYSEVTVKSLPHAYISADSCSLATKYQSENERAVCISKVRSYLLLKPELEGQITERFASNTGERKIGVSLSVCRLLADDNI